MTEITPNASDLSARQIPPHGRELYGHPRGLWVLVITEAWLAFSLYGMISLLVLYMSKVIFAPDTMKTVWGLEPLLRFTNLLYAPVGTVAIAGGIMGLFMALIFAMPLFGGLLADRWLGRTRTILLGAVLMTVGNILLCFTPCFVLALIALLIGNGCAGSMKAQVGALYALDDRRRSDAYQLYTLGVQIAVIVSPILCSTLSTIAWHWGFLAAGAGMGLGVLCYMLGVRYLPPEPGSLRKTRHGQKSSRLNLTRVERQRVWLLLGLVLVFAIGALPNEELNDGYVLWASQHYRLALWGHPFPVSYLISLDGFISTVTTLWVLWALQAYEKRYGVLHEITKVSIGTLIASFGPLCLALGSWLSPGPHQVSLWWGILFHTINDIGFAMSYSIGMALFSRVAPVSLNTVFVSCFVLHLFLSNLMIGKLATLITRMPDIAFWLLHSGVSFAAAAIFGLCALFFRQLLAVGKRS